jgi:glucosamine--fructose-6-phosphate aminotransferase (isomerizing)
MYTSPDVVRDAHPYFMYDEIMGQSQSIERSLRRVQESGAEPSRLLARARRVFLVGSGTSLHAAEAGAWFFRTLSRGKIEAQAVQSFELVAYLPGLRPDDAVIAVSHSGTSHMTIRALERARRSGVETIVLTGFPNSEAAGAAQHVLVTGFDEEHSWAHTASYTAALTSLVALANNLASPEEQLDLSPLPAVVKEVLELEEMTHRLAANLLVAERTGVPPSIVLVGGGPNAVTAREAQLKLLETCYVQPLAFELEQILHGALAALTRDTLVILVAPHGASTDRATELCRALYRLEIHPVVLCGSDNAEAFSEAHRFVMPDVPEAISPIASVVPLQLFSYFLSVGRGNNPDLIHRDDERQRAARAEYA